MDTSLPLSGIRCVEHSTSVAAAYAGRLLAAMGAEVILIEPQEGSPLRREPPFLGPKSEESAVFAYLCAGKRSVMIDLDTECGRRELSVMLETSDILIEDIAMADKRRMGVDPEVVAVTLPNLVHLSVLPFGSYGSKSNWAGSELNLIHSSGEGFLLPNGLSASLFPDRPPLKIAGHFAAMQGGIAGALSALAAVWSGKGQYVDVSIQDANLAVGAFTVQRYGDGSLEHRLTRSFRYGGVIECRDGYVELLTLEQRQWHGLVELMGYPEWAQDAALEDAVIRSQRGDLINQEIRKWAARYPVDEIVAAAQRLGVPMARYNTPEQILSGQHEEARGLFSSIERADGGVCRIQSAPFRFGPDPLPVISWPAMPEANVASTSENAAAPSEKMFWKEQA
ncbi:CoA transferase [Agrobacterium salinitolerans]|uniref:CaiB/BaiF CoA transferase family protein n=1 Tax=Agrobacterium salinitolerans TaxID=1183413 RepID=UPI00098FCB83|nr:CoA transferase [Agrobacterium salinitolerans]OOO27874.1 CoA transferase [Agrobacterium salinitolerans]PNQ25773.1 CoA transferase [Rhizobium sp. YIC5082]